MGLPEVVAWYEQKTRFLIEKYGPGPRVHYHTGLVSPDAVPARQIEALRLQIVASQETMLSRAAQVWDAEHTLRGRELLDVGCGLGGGPLFWAQEYDAKVVALTPVPSHVEVVTAFARAAGVEARVKCELGDAHAVAGRARFDAAVATGASNYLDRKRWFERLAVVLRPHGRVLIEDTFLVDAKLAPHFNDYWLSNIGTRDEYLKAAEGAGFELVSCVDVTYEAAGFWRLSNAYSERLLEAGGLSPSEVNERQRSIRWQSRVHQAYLDQGFENLLLHFARRP
jgi:SAM-dependent methyltransferase